MKLKNFDANIAAKVIDLWKEHLGIHSRTSPHFDPEFLAEEVRDSHTWVTGRYDPRIGSKFTDDSKLLVSLRDGKVVIECYVQAHTVAKDRQQEALTAEETFNKAMVDYVNTIP